MTGRNFSRKNPSRKCLCKNLDSRYPIHIGLAVWQAIAKDRQETLVREDNGRSDIPMPKRRDVAQWVKAVDFDSTNGGSNPSIPSNFSEKTPPVFSNRGCFPFH